MKDMCTRCVKVSILVVSIGRGAYYHLMQVSCGAKCVKMDFKSQESLQI